MNYFDAFDIVECTWAHPNFGYIVGRQYLVFESAISPPDTYIADPTAGVSGVGLSCDRPWAPHHFRLVHKAPLLVTAPGNNVAPAPPSTSSPSVKVGDYVTVTDVVHTGLPMAARGDTLEVVGVSNMPTSSGLPWVTVNYHGVGYTVRDDQYMVCTAPASPTGQFQAAWQGHVQAQARKILAVAQAFTAPKMISLKDAYDLYPAKSPGCECGAEKCGQPRHSDWCPKHSL